MLAWGKEAFCCAKKGDEGICLQEVLSNEMVDGNIPLAWGIFVRRVALTAGEIFSVFR